MQRYEFTDVLTGAHLECLYPGMQALKVKQSSSPEQATSIFFPGCSFLNYALPLVSSVYDVLKRDGAVDGISLLCCGKILSFEPDGEAVRAAYEVQFREHLLESGVKRIVAACPNCVKALRGFLEEDEATADIEIVALASEFARLGYRIDKDIAGSQIAAEYERNGASYAVEIADIAPGDLKFCVHDSCPDRDTGEFADGIRALLGEDLIHETNHIRQKSYCCGSLVRAAGKYDAAVKMTKRHGQEAEDAGVQAIAASCMSCAYMLSNNQKAVPAFHYLELLFNWRIDWPTADEYMKLRFLFDDALGMIDMTAAESDNSTQLAHSNDADAASGSRAFIGLEN